MRALGYVIKAGLHTEKGAQTHNGRTHMLQDAKSIWGLHRTYYVMFRRRIEGREKDGSR